MQQVEQDKLRDKLADYVEDAHALESSVVDNLDTMIGTIDDPKLKEVLQRNRQVSRQHVERLKQRLEHLDRGTPVRKRIEGMALALMKGVSDVLRTDTAGQGRAATRTCSRRRRSPRTSCSADSPTARETRRRPSSRVTHLAEDKSCADDVAANWDGFFELTLASWRDRAPETATATV